MIQYLHWQQTKKPIFGIISQSNNIFSTIFSKTLLITIIHKTLIVKMQVQVHEMLRKKWNLQWHYKYKFFNKELYVKSTFLLNNPVFVDNHLWRHLWSPLGRHLRRHVESARSQSLRLDSIRIFISVVQIIIIHFADCGGYAER